MNPIAIVSIDRFGVSYCASSAWKVRLRKRSGVTYKRSSLPATAASSARLRVAAGIEEFTAAARMPLAFSASTWSFIRAISGLTTSTSPSSATAGSW